MRNQVMRIVEDSLAVKKKSIEDNTGTIISTVEVLIEAFKKNYKVLIFGNGGSAADAQHIAAEFVGRFKQERRALPAIALSTDTSILTALGNDYGFDVVFSRQIEGLGQPGDIAWGISTSGNSVNVIQGILKAKEKGLKTISLTGGKGGRLAVLTDISLIVDSNNTARVQEAHLCIEHIICDLVEQAFCPIK